MTTKLGLVAVALLLVSTPAGADEPRAFEIADYYRTAFVGSPAVSPDATTVAVAVTRYELEEGASWSEIWVFGSHGSRPRQMTRGRHHDGDPVFSPDGRSLLFTSDRDGDATQLFVMPLDGGEPRQLTDFPMALSDPVWSPDGRWIAATAHVYPECGADADCNATMRDAAARGPLSAYLADELLYRHWDSWRAGRYPHVLLVDAESGGVVRDLTPGRWDSPTFSLGGGPGYAFSPDGSELCFVSNRDPVPALSTNSDLWVVPVEDDSGSTTARNLTAGNRGWDGNPVYSPDGGSIGYLSQETPGFEADLFRLAVLDLRDGTTRYLSSRAGFDDWATALQWHRDSAGLTFQAEVEGRTPLYDVDLKSGAIREIVRDGAISGWRLTPSGNAVIYTRSKVGGPSEVFRLELDEDAPVQISSFNDELAAEVDIRPAEELWVDGAGDYRVQVFVVTPHGFDPTKRYPLILNVHGGPQQQWTDRYRGDWQVYPGKGYVVAFANPSGSPGFGQDYVDAISCDWGGRVFDDLMKVSDSLAKIPYVDPNRMGAMGWSYGGYMMMWFAGHTDRFAALASMMGVYDLRSMYSATEELWFPEHDLCGAPWSSEDYRRWSPSNFVTSFSTPTLVITGERDYRVPYTQSLEFFTDLQLMEVPSRLVVFPNAGHWPSWYEMAFYYLVHVDWFHRWLGGDPPTWDVERFLRNRVFEGDGNLGAPSAEGSDTD